MEVSNDGRTSPSGSLNSSRERSNSDPGRREMTVVMNGGNTVPTRRTPAFINSTEVDSSVASANSTPSTPPPVRRSKLAVSIGRLLRPWKWRRRKKSQKFITTSQSKQCFILSFCGPYLFSFLEGGSWRFTYGKPRTGCRYVLSPIQFVPLESIYFSCY